MAHEYYEYAVSEQFATFPFHPERNKGSECQKLLLR